MSFRQVSQCKICNSGFRDKVDIMIAKGTPQKKIVAYLKKQGIPVSGSAVYRHNLRHRKPSSNDLRKYAPNKQIKTSAKKAQKLSEDEAVRLFTHAQFLKDIIMEVHQKLKAKTITANLSDALKAFELLQKMDHNQSPLERAMVEFILGLSVENFS